MLSIMLLLTVQERQFLSNYLINRTQDSTSTTPSKEELLLIRGLVIKIKSIVSDITQQETGYLQFILREANEIYGNQRSVANDKSSIPPGTKFFPHMSMILIKSISDKLGSKLTVDTTTESDQVVPRAEGSNWILTNPTQKPISG